MTRITTDNICYYGDIIEHIGSKIILKCALTNKELEIFLNDTHSMETTQEDYLNKTIEIIKSVKTDRLFTKKDYDIIKNAQDVVLKYNELYTLRALGLTESNIIDVNIDICRQALIDVASEVLSDNITLIDIDEDLNEEEKELVRKSFTEQHNSFLVAFNSLNSLLELFQNLPGNLINEKLKYKYAVIRILEDEKNLPNNV